MTGPGVARPDERAQDSPLPNPPSDRTIAARGMGWQTAATATTQILQAAVTIVAAAAVGPAGFGLWGLATVLFNAQFVLSAVGLGPALIFVGANSRSRKSVNAANTFAAVLAALVAGTLVLLAPMLATFFGPSFDQADVVSVIRIMAIVLALTTLAQIPQALLEGSFSFRSRALVNLQGAIAYAAIAGVLLVSGAGVLGLVWARLVQALLVLAVSWSAAPLRPRLPGPLDGGALHPCCDTGASQPLPQRSALRSETPTTSSSAMSRGPMALAYTHSRSLWPPWRRPCSPRHSAGSSFRSSRRRGTIRSGLGGACLTASDTRAS